MIDRFGNRDAVFDSSVFLRSIVAAHDEKFMQRQMIIAIFVVVSCVILVGMSITESDFLVL